MDKVFCGGGWSKKFDNGGENISCAVDPEVIANLPKDSYGMVRIVVGTRKAQDEKSKQTHWVSTDGFYYEKNPKGEAPRDPEVRKSNKPDIDLPF
jgi:hypothetical protein